MGRKIPLLFCGRTKTFPPEQADLENHEQNNIYFVLLYRLPHAGAGHLSCKLCTLMTVKPQKVTTSQIMFKSCWDIAVNAKHTVVWCNIWRDKDEVLCMCVNWPAMMKITPPARATLSFCCGSSAIQVVHLMPTISTKIEIKLSKMEDSISPRAPCTIPGDKDTTQDHFQHFKCYGFLIFNTFGFDLSLHTVE